MVFAINILLNNQNPKPKIAFHQLNDYDMIFFS